MREVSCLFATRWDKVLLATKDGGKNWHFPQEEVRRDVKGNPIETPLDAIYRIVDKLDGIEEEALKRLPAYQQIQVHAAVRRQLDKAKADGDDVLAQFWQKELQVLEQTMLGAPNQKAQSGDRPGMAPSALSTPAQQQGVPSALMSPAAPQLGG